MIASACRATHANFVLNASFEEVVYKRVGVFTLAEDRRYFQIQVGHFREANPENRSVEKENRENDKTVPYAIARRRRNVDLEKDRVDKKRPRASSTNCHDATEIRQFDVDAHFGIGQFLDHTSDRFESCESLEMFVRRHLGQQRAELARSHA